MQAKIAISVVDRRIAGKYAASVNALKKARKRKKLTQEGLAA